MSMFPPRKPAKPFGMPHTPFNPLTGKHFAFGDAEGDVAVLTVRAIGHNVLLCGDRNGNAILILKPRDLRKSTFDGETIDGVTYTSTGLDTRTASDGVETDETQLVTRSYYVGEKITAFRHHENDRARGEVAAGEITGVDAGDYLLEWEDSGVGRAWATEPAE